MLGVPADAAKAGDAGHLELAEHASGLGYLEDRSVAPAADQQLCAVEGDAGLADGTGVLLGAGRGRVRARTRRAWPLVVVDLHRPGRRARPCRHRQQPHECDHDPPDLSPQAMKGALSSTKPGVSPRQLPRRQRRWAAASTRTTNPVTRIGRRFRVMAIRVPECGRKEWYGESFTVG